MPRARDRALTPILLGFAVSHALAGYDANGVVLGATESEVREAFPSVHCRPLEWQSLAADRRCDGSRLDLGGVSVRITFYLRQDALEAFDVRFGMRDLERFSAFLKERYGVPRSDEERAVRTNRPERKFRRIAWEAEGERAVITAPLGDRRASLLVSRGRFEEEIYR